MWQLREMLSQELQDLLYAETLLTKALPQMAQAAHNPRLREAFEQHLNETETHVERLKKAFDLLGQKAQSKTCKAMVGLVEEGKEIMGEGKDKPEIAADLALITAAQKVEHYEISGYGTVRNLARQIGEIEISKLMSHTLGEEEGADFLLTDIAKPLLQEAAAEELSKGKAEHRPTKTAAHSGAR